MLLGPSGCGKSTLLNIVAGLLKADEGAAHLDGRPIVGPGPDRTLVFQDGALFPWLTARGNVEFGLPAGPERRKTAETALEKVGLAGKGDLSIHELSGGMRQRVAIARALAVRPRMLLLDEPFSALDAITRESLYGVVQELRESEGTAMLFVTHNVREAVTLGDRVLVMAPRPGRIVAEFAVPLPRPRHIDDAGVSALAREISATLRGDE